MNSNPSTQNSLTEEMTEVVDGLNDLLQLDHDAIGAYEVAIEKLEDRGHASQIRGFKRDHERHIESLNKMILSLGGAPKNEPHGTGPLKQALQGLGGVAGDKGILMAWRTNELQVRSKYDRYASMANAWPSEVKRIIDENALDEERHYHWVAEALEAMGIGKGEGMESHLADQAREKSAAMRQKAQGFQSEIESRTRTEPMKLLLASFAVGFVIGRILR